MKRETEGGKFPPTPTPPAKDNDVSRTFQQCNYYVKGLHNTSGFSLSWGKWVVVAGTFTSWNGMKPTTTGCSSAQVLEPQIYHLRTWWGNVFILGSPAATRAAGDALRRGREVDDWGFFLSLSVVYEKRLARWKLFQCQGHLDVRGGWLSE